MSISNGLSGFAIVISLVAACFTGLQWREAHRQLVSSMRPSINFMSEDDPDELPNGIGVENAGPGPAIIKSVTYFVDKKPVGDVNKAVDFANLEDVHVLDLEDGETLAVGKTEWLMKYTKKPRGKQDQAAQDKFLDLIDHHLAVEVRFCPVLSDDCGKKCSTKDWCD